MAIIIGNLAYSIIEILINVELLKKNTLHQNLSYDFK